MAGLTVEVLGHFSPVVKLLISAAVYVLLKSWYEHTQV